MTEPHPLPLTRQWVADYKKYGSGPARAKGIRGLLFEEWLKDNPYPDLLGPQDWANYDRQVTDWQRRRRER